MPVENPLQYIWSEDLRSLRDRIRELELRLADAHIIEMHPEHHGRCIKEINALKADRDQLKTELNKMTAKWAAECIQRKVLAANCNRSESTNKPKEN